MSLTLDSKYYRNEETWRTRDRYRIPMLRNDSIKEDVSNYQTDEKDEKKGFFGKMVNKFKKFPSKILTAKQTRENDNFKETKNYQEGNDFIYISKNLKNKKTGEEITQEFSIKGGTTNNQSNYDKFLKSEQLQKKNWNSKNKKKNKYKSKKKCRYGQNCRNKKNCKFNHDYDQNNNQQLQNYNRNRNRNNNQQLQNYHQNNNKFVFDDNFATTFFS